MGPDAIENLLKQIRLSERPRGAFLLVASSEAEFRVLDLPKPPNFDALLAVRNNVVHSGYIPTQTEAKAHARSTIKYVAGFLQSLKNYDHVAVMKAVNFYHARSYESARAKVGEERKIWSGPAQSQISTTISPQDQTLEEIEYDFDKMVGFARELQERWRNHVKEAQRT